MNKKSYFQLGFLFCFLSFALGCTSSPRNSANTTSLEQAIESSVKSIEAQLPNGAQLAVLTFTASSPAFSDYILSELAIAFASSNKLTVIDRQYTEVIRKEMDIQMSGDISDNEVRRIGHQLGAQYVVTGSIVDIGNSYRFRVVAIDVETAIHATSTSLNINRNDQQVAFFLSGQRVGNRERVFRIGELGPAGGLIFYDKGVFSNGWRYMEAAPLEAEFKTNSGWNWDHHLHGTRNEVGFGKHNTEIMVEYLNQIGESGHIAQLCNDLNFDGFNDWFLPSKDELDLMYKNLKQRGLGGFANILYCSSSIQSYWSNIFRRDISDVWKQNFDNGMQAHDWLPPLGDYPPDERARAVRYF